MVGRGGYRFMNLFLPVRGGMHKPAVSSGGGGSWTPASISGLYQWFDAQDSNSITKDGSNYVTQWNDKSGNGGHLTASGTNGPVLTASAIGTNPAMVFGTSSSLANATSYGLQFLKNQSGATIVMVFVMTSHASGGLFYHWSSGSGSGYSRVTLMDHGWGSFIAWCRRTDGEYFTQNYSDSANQTNTTMIHRMSLDYANGAYHEYLNLTGDTTDIANTSFPSSGNVSDTSSASACLNTSGGSDGMAMKVGELITIRGVLSSSDVTSLNTYLKNKWGIT
jgi:hypothetical protein